MLKKQQQQTMYTNPEYNVLALNQTFKWLQQLNFSLGTIISK